MVRNYVYETSKLLSESREEKNRGRLPFYFTFGIGHVNQGQYMIIWAKDSGSARNKMFELFGNKWSMQYLEEHWHDEEGVPLSVKWNWTLLKEIQA